MSKKQEEAQEYMEDLKEWQKNQYMPGYYVGSKMHPALKRGGKRYIVGTLIFAAVAIILVFIASILT